MLLFMLLLAAALTAALPTAAPAMPLLDNDTMKLNMHAYVQALGVAEDVPDKIRNNERFYLFLKEARLRFDGALYGTTFDIMLATGGEDITPNTNAALGLLDFSFEVPLPIVGGTSAKIGQFLVPYSRERLTDDSTMSFGERSVENLGFAWNRDYGVALSGYQDKLAGTLAVMSGGGRDIPQRFLPEVLGFPMIVARVGYNDGIDKDIYHVTARDADPDRVKSAAYVNGLFMKDSLIGHSTVINVRATDKNLLVDPNYNPFIAKAPFSLATIWQLGGDAAYRVPLRSGAFNAEAQVDYSHFNNKYGSLSLKGGRVQAGISRGKLEANLRYSVLFLDQRMAFVSGGVAFPIVKNKTPLQEITPSFTYHFRPGVSAHLDFPVLINMLVFRENTIGSYVMTEQPDQVTVIKPGTTAGTGSVTRNNVAEVRLMLQLGF
jgi:hypothetical protein